MIQKKAKENQGTRNDLVQKSSQSKGDGKSREQVAKLAGVSHDTVSKYKKVKEEASPELLLQVLKSNKVFNAC